MPCAIPSCDQPVQARGWCDKHYRRWLKHGDPLFDRKPGRPSGGKRPLIDRALDKVDISEDGCWMWTGALMAVGYGAIHSGQRPGHAALAHRVMYEHFVGPVPEGMVLDHLCHNSDITCRGGSTCRHRACVRPDHLTPITRSENAAGPDHDTARAVRAAGGRLGAARRWHPETA